MDDADLLKDFAATRSQGAFAELVRRHVDMVYAAARRQVRDPGLADDVTQGVFIVLARRANTIRDAASLPGWLLSTTRYVATTANRARHRRDRKETEAAAMRSHEDTLDRKQAWQDMQPAIDDAMSSLSTADRNVLALRYFQDISLAQVGGSIGISEEAARKRVDRALDKLRTILCRRGVTMSLASVASGIALAAKPSAAPAALASTISTAIASTAATGAGVTLAEAAMNVMLWAKIKLAALLIAACAIPVTVAAVAIPHTTTKRAGVTFVFHGRLVDGKAAPVAGARIEMWADKDGREERPKTTSDADGKFTIANTLNPKFLLAVSKPGYREITTKEMETTDALQSVTFLRLLTVSGKVTDAATHQPLPAFTVMPGGAWHANQRFVERDLAQPGVNGQYAQLFKWPYPEVWVRIEAAGYLPAESQIFRTEEGTATADIELKPAPVVTAKVLLPDGSPAAGALILVGDQRSSIFLDDAIPRPSKVPTSQHSTARLQTADDGSFTVPPQPGTFQLAAVHDQGVAFAYCNAEHPPGVIQLNAWARVAGEIAPSLRTKQAQSVYIMLQNGDALYRQEQSVRPDGTFAFDHVPPGRVSVGIVEKFERSRIGITVFDHLLVFSLAPGATTRPTLGGNGATVAGRVELPKFIPGDLASRFVSGQSLTPSPWLRAGTRPTMADLDRHNANARSFAVRINNDGTFRIKDVPAGEYDLRIDVQELNDGPSWGPGKPVARLLAPVKVSQTADLCDVGVFVLEPPARACDSTGCKIICPDGSIAGDTYLLPCDAVSPAGFR